jgi:hypothetical protein
MFAAVLLHTLLAVTPALGAPPPPAALAADPCDGIASLPDEPACGGAPLCAPRQRVKVACGLRDAMESRYVFFPVKRAMLGGSGGQAFDSRSRLDACVAEERAIGREDDATRFYDRMRRCTAAFQDGHLILGAPARLPLVALGVGLRLADGKVYVANRERKLAGTLSASSVARDLEAVLAVGNEVLEVDGRPVADWLEELGRYVPASSPAARLERAVDALTRRDFLYPERRTATLTVLVNGARRAVELPWWISPDAAGHVMTQGYLRRTGIPTGGPITWRRDAAKEASEEAAVLGYLRTDTILPPSDAAGLREYLSDQDRPAVRLGEVVRRKDRAFCYLQILTFHTESLGDRDGRQPFATVLEGFVKECKEKELDLVLDLRQNEGGYISHSSALLGMLSPKGRSYPGGALLLRANTLNQLVFQQRSQTVGGIAARAAGGEFEPRVVEAIGEARRARQDFTPAFLEPPVRASEAVGGYDGRVVALVAPTCMSACDRLAGMLRGAGRAVLVGGPTEGAGGSQQEAKDLSARWTDPEGLLSLSIPNAAFGVQHDLPAEQRAERSADEFFRALAVENHPVPPDVPYATGLEDVTGHNRGWLAKAEAALFGRE